MRSIFMGQPSISHRGLKDSFSTPVSRQTCILAMRRQLTHCLVLQSTYGSSMGLTAAGEDRAGIINSRKVCLARVSVTFADLGS